MEETLQVRIVDPTMSESGIHAATLEYKGGDRGMCKNCPSSIFPSGEPLTPYQIALLTKRQEEGGVQRTFFCQGFGNEDEFRDSCSIASATTPVGIWTMDTVGKTYDKVKCQVVSGETLNRQRKE